MLHKILLIDHWALCFPEWALPCQHVAGLYSSWPLCKYAFVKQIYLFQNFLFLEVVLPLLVCTQYEINSLSYWARPPIKCSSLQRDP